MYLCFYNRNDWTKTTHLRAIDIWVVLCYIGVFSSLMEYCLILYLTKTSILDGLMNSTKQKVHESTNEDEKDNCTETENKQKNLKLARLIEKMSRVTLITYIIVFPITYFVVCSTFS